MRILFVTLLGLLLNTTSFAEDKKPCRISLEKVAAESKTSAPASTKVIEEKDRKVVEVSVQGEKEPHRFEFPKELVVDADNRNGLILRGKLPSHAKSKDPLPGGKNRKGFTLPETLVVSAIMAVLMGLLIPAVQNVREAANNNSCKNNMRQIGFAITQYAEANGVYPRSFEQGSPVNPFEHKDSAGNPLRKWMTVILPYVDQGALESQGFAAYSNAVVDIYRCPSDPRPAERGVLGGQIGGGLTNYMAVTGSVGGYGGAPTNGIGFYAQDGVITGDSYSQWQTPNPYLYNPDGKGKVTPTMLASDHSDGSSNTVMVGERPPNTNLQWGWWIWGAYDSSLPALSGNSGYSLSAGSTCAFKGEYGPGSINNPCDVYHFWSPHRAEGGNWIFADGSVRFIPYKAKTILPALSTHSGHEVLEAWE